MRLALPGALLLALAVALAPEAPEATGATEAIAERRLGLMGTTLEIAVTARDRATALAASERAVAALAAAEARLSTWRDDTELARLNRAPAGEPFALSAALATDLAAARACWQETGGAFDPAVAPLVRAWGLRTGGRLPSEAERRAALAASGLGLIGLARGTAVRRHPDAAIEEGGFGKGAGLRDALAALKAAPGVTSARLDLGGQLAVVGRGARGVFRAAIADPRHRDRPVVELEIDGGSVSTSGNGERGLVVDGRAVGHILDPRTGAPAPDVGSVTVWTADPLAADCLSTGLFVMGPERAVAWAAGRPGVEVVALVPRGDRLAALASPGLAGRLEPLAPGVEIEIRRERTVTER